ncbi:hypothetical protein ACU61A_16395 [Pseudonocardia sichuanensis]|uniref:SurA-like protein n=1 Tax=Pseudonocardia kunmingensis TaxID=630975 RepID=A0A543D9A9_9PSEU|nr:hypothetical protein [Pseudonocardia kunmingensis]TQM05900.1 hypothetical protein FB558_6123 [Pseudonocardia kunmingensis]
MRMRVGRVAAAVVVVAAVVSGCGGPGQAGTAVVVGDQAVPLERVQGQLDAALSLHDPAELAARQVTPARLARDIVTREVMHGLLARRAAEEGITVTEPQVDAQLALLAQPDPSGRLGVEDFLQGPELRSWARDQVIAAQLGQRLVPGLQVTVDLVAATSREDAQAKSEVLARGGPEADALTANPQTGRSGLTVQAAASPGDAASPAFWVPAGSVVAYQADPRQNGWLILRVTDRRTDAPTDPAALSSLSQAEFVAIGLRSLQQTIDEVGVEINPRYGVMDPIQLRVVGEDEQAGMILPPAAA